MELVEEFGAELNKYSKINECKNFFCSSGQDHPLTFNHCITYFDSFKLQRLFK